MSVRPMILAALVALVSLPASARTEWHSLSIDGQRRSYLLYVPDHAAAVPEGGRRLIVVLHGGDGTSRQIRRSAGSGLEARAVTDGIVIVYPQAIDRIWDFGEGTISDALETPRDDLKFLVAMIREVVDTQHVDETRVFATGVSRGGQASYYLACAAPGLIRAIAPVAMPLPDFLEDDCAKVPPTPILVINGTLDPIVPFDGGPILIRDRERGDVLSTDATMKLFAARNGCSRRYWQTSSGSIDWLIWTGCDAPTELLRVRDGGHGWPGDPSPLPKRLVGPASRDLDATRAVWDFFARF